MRAPVDVIGGFVLLAVGIVGLALPIMPGWIFIIPGLLLLGRHFHWARRLLDYLHRKYSHLQGGKPQP